MAQPNRRKEIQDSQFAVTDDNGGRPGIVADLEGKILDANDKFLLATGYSLKELKGVGIVDLVAPDDREQVTEHYRQMNESGKSSVVARLLTKGGLTIHAQFMTNVLPAGRFRTIVADAVGRLPEHELHYGNRYTLALFEIGRQMTSSFDVGEVMRLVVKNVAWLLECHFVGIAQFDSAHKTISYREVVGNKYPLVLSSANDSNREISGRVIATQKPFIIESFPTKPLLDPSEFEIMASEMLTSAFGVPISNKGREFGALVVGYRRYHQISEDEVQLTMNLANQAALALENAKLYQEKVEYSKSMAALTRRLTVIQEEERRRITRDLHDGVGQALTGLRLNLDLLSRQIPITEQSAADRVSMMKQVIDETLGTIREIAFDLRPPILDDLGLISALRVYIDRFAERTKIVSSLKCLEDLKRFDPKVEATLYRVVQEALTNVAKHSGAREVVVELRKTDNALMLNIFDNGKGFDDGHSAKPGFGTSGLGLMNMNERISGVQGQFSLSTERGKGTKIFIEVPFHGR